MAECVFAVLNNEGEQVFGIHRDGRVEYMTESGEHRVVQGDEELVEVTSKAMDAITKMKASNPVSASSFNSTGTGEISYEGSTTVEEFAKNNQVGEGSKIVRKDGISNVFKIVDKDAKIPAGWSEYKP